MQTNNIKQHKTHRQNIKNKHTHTHTYTHTHRHTQTHTHTHTQFYQCGNESDKEISLKIKKIKKPNCKYYEISN